MIYLHVIKTQTLPPAPSAAESLLWQWSEFITSKLRELPATEAVVLSGRLRCWSDSMLMVAELELGGLRPVGCADPAIAAAVLRRFGWSVGQGPAREPLSPYREIEIRPGHPIVFLGIHGVVERPEGGLVAVAVERAARLCADTGARIVLTSFMRRWGVEHCTAYLQEAGLAPGLVVDVVPWLTQASRGEEITRWLADNLTRPYVVVDDAAEAGLGHHGRVVRVGPMGLEDADVEHATRILRGAP